MSWRVRVDHQSCRESSRSRRVRGDARRRLRAADAGRATRRPPVPAIIPRDVAAPQRACAAPASPRGTRQTAANAGSRGHQRHVGADAPGRDLRRRRTAPSAGSHRPPPPRRTAAADAGTQPGGLRALSRPFCSRTGTRTRIRSPTRTGRRRSAAPDAATTVRAPRPGDRCRGFRLLQPRGPIPCHRLPRGTGARRRPYPVAGGGPAHRLTTAGRRPAANLIAARRG